MTFVFISLNLSSHSQADRILDYRERQVEVEMTDAEIEQQDKLLDQEEEREEISAQKEEDGDGDNMLMKISPSKRASSPHRLKTSGGKELSLLSLSRTDNRDDKEEDEDDDEDNDQPGGRRHKSDVGAHFELWQPLRRCEVVLHVLASDDFADPFNAPVELSDFPDYMQYIQTPMDLSTVRSRLEKGKYKDVDMFKRDVRLVWSNCKRYNLAASPIWKLAHAFAEAFEKTMKDWVFAFQVSKLPWSNPKARPWETSSGDFKTVVRHENYDKPVKLVTVSEYLVKWSGLSYRDSTWESLEDVKGHRLDAGSKIALFHGANDSVPTEQLLSVEEMNTELSLAKNLTFPAIDEGDAMAEAEVQLQMQVR